MLLLPSCVPNALSTDLQYRTRFTVQGMMTQLLDMKGQALLDGVHAFYMERLGATGKAVNAIFRSKEPALLIF